MITRTNLKYDIWGNTGASIDLENCFFEFWITTSNNLRLLNIFTRLDDSNDAHKVIKAKDNVYHYNDLKALNNSFIIRKKGGFTSYRTVSGLMKKINKDFNAITGV
tara:strand:- start:445 stop:762 length:318 start_codon:yes stop_codon:yes gene_type:complete